MPWRRRRPCPRAAIGEPGPGVAFRSVSDWTPAEKPLSLGRSQMRKAEDTVFSICVKYRTRMAGKSLHSRFPFLRLFFKLLKYNMIYSQAEFGTKIAYLNVSLALCRPFQTYRWKKHKALLVFFINRRTIRICKGHFIVHV